MSAQSIEIVTLALQNPEFFDASDERWSELPANVSFQYDLEHTVRTLSTTAAPGTDDISGLLYVPTLNNKAHQAACPEGQNSTWLPRNATHRADLPVNYELVALAPWLNVNCTKAFLEAASNDLLAAMIFYLPPDSNVSTSPSNTSAPAGAGAPIPPEANDPVWDLHDGGNWKSHFNFPVYAVPSELGVLWMQELTAYNGNSTTVPHGKQLSDMGLVEPTDFVRLMADISTGGGSRIPSLWVFLLIVLALLILIIAFTSGLMHFVARQRRSLLRRRIANGEIDLEALGIKRLMVPREVLDKMPLYPYTAAQTPPSPSTRTSDPISTAKSPTAASSASAATPRAATPRAATPRASQHHLSLQTTCAICLDDFQSSPPADAASMVRELPCAHIFHAECVDPFLTTHSSLCPLCKKSSLPVGYVPKTITNTMVRRERQVRRLRGRGIRVRNPGRLSEDGTRHSVGPGGVSRVGERSLVDRIADGGLVNALPPRLQSALHRARTRMPFGAAPQATSGSGAGTQMREIGSAPDVTSTPPPPRNVPSVASTAAPVVIAAERRTPSPAPAAAAGQERDIEQGVREGPAPATAVLPLQTTPGDTAAAPAASSATAGPPKGWLKASFGKMFPRSA